MLERERKRERDREKRRERREIVRRVSGRDKRPSTNRKARSFKLRKEKVMRLRLIWLNSDYLEC